MGRVRCWDGNILNFLFFGKLLPHKEDINRDHMPTLGYLQGNCCIWSIFQADRIGFFPWTNREKLFDFKNIDV